MQGYSYKIEANDANVTLLIKWSINLGLEELVETWDVSSIWHGISWELM